MLPSALTYLSRDRNTARRIATASVVLAVPIFILVLFVVAGPLDARYGMAARNIRMMLLLGVFNLLIIGIAQLLFVGFYVQLLAKTMETQTPIAEARASISMIKGTVFAVLAACVYLPIWVCVFGIGYVFILQLGTVTISPGGLAEVTLSPSWLGIPYLVVSVGCVALLPATQTIRMLSAERGIGSLRQPLQTARIAFSKPFVRAWVVAIGLATVGGIFAYSLYTVIVVSIMGPWLAIGGVPGPAWVLAQGTGSLLYGGAVFYSTTVSVSYFGLSVRNVL